MGFKDLFDEIEKGLQRTLTQDENNTVRCLWITGLYSIEDIVDGFIEVKNVKARCKL